MSEQEIDVKRLREVAEAAIESVQPYCEEWHREHVLVGQGKTRGDAKFIAAMSPRAVLALLDRLEAAEEFAQYAEQDRDAVLAELRDLRDSQEAGR